MKKTLLTALILLLIVLLTYTVVQGWKIGPINVLSFGGIQEKDAQLEGEIQKATRLASMDYESQLTEEDINIEALENMKKQYEDLVTVNTAEGAQPTTQLEKYEMEYLWTQIGNHAKEEGIPILKIDVEKSFDPKAVENVEGQEGEQAEGEGNTTGNTTTNNTSNSDVSLDEYSLEAAAVTSTSTGADSADDGEYDLTFQATGPYVSVADFIYAIENDSTLGFKIEEFEMNEGSDIEKNGYVVGRFKCKGIRIKKVTRTTTEQKEDDENKNNNNENNTTNSTNTTDRTSNSTNTTNRTSSKSNTASSN